MNSAIQYSFKQQIGIEYYLWARHYTQYLEHKKVDIAPALFVLVVLWKD